MTIIGDFVRRQTKDSEYSYFDGSWEIVLSVIERVENSAFCKYIPGPRDGIRLLRIPPEGFYSSIVPMSPEIEFVSEWKARREGEQPILKRVAYGKKVPAKSVEVVLYHSTVLREDPLYTGPDGDYWEVVSINASSFAYPIPMAPMTMARNQLELPGGTKVDYTGRQFAEAIVFWNNHIQVREKV
jgi:hypothetical protein